jgi:hypothetical protein
MAASAATSQRGLPPGLAGLGSRHVGVLPRSAGITLVASHLVTEGAQGAAVRSRAHLTIRALAGQVDPHNEQAAIHCG